MPFIVKKKLGKSSYNILCTDGELHADCYVGPMQFSAKIYKTWAGADKRAQRFNAVVSKINDRGVEV